MAARESSSDQVRTPAKPKSTRFPVSGIPSARTVDSVQYR
jgi:hypothetical protein